MKHIRQAHHERIAWQPFEVELLPPKVLDSVLEPGFHYKHYSSSRDVLDCLASMSAFGRLVGLLSLDPNLFGSLVVSKPYDLLDELASAQAFVHEDMLAHWLTTSCPYDAIVIDASQELLQSDWFGLLEAAFIESGCSKRMPIAFLFRI